MGNRDIDAASIADFEAIALRNTSTESTRNFNDAEERAAIAKAAAEAAKRNRS